MDLSINDIISNIDRIIIRYQFCFQDNMNTLINNSDMKIITDKFEEDVYLLPHHIQIYPITSCLNSFLLENMNAKYKYIMININTKEIYCISKNMKDFLLIFEKPIKKEQLIYYFGLFEMEYFFLLSILVDNDIVMSTYNSKYIEYKSVKNNLIYTLEDYKIETIIYENCFKKICLIKNFKNQKFILKYLKFIGNECLQELFNNEFNILNELQNCPYFCSIIYHNHLEYYGILEYVEGVDLDDYLSKENLSIIERINIIKKIIDIIAFLHEKNILHGDIHLNQFKIDNIGNIKLLDLELASKINFNNDIQSKCFGGIFEYFEPENITLNPFTLLKGRITKIAEVYRVGIAIYYILFGEYPFLEITWQNLYKAKIKKNPYFCKYTKKGEVVPVFILVSCQSKIVG